jgi:hypothetical protein
MPAISVIQKGKQRAGDRLLSQLAREELGKKKVEN